MRPPPPIADDPPEPRPFGPGLWSAPSPGPARAAVPRDSAAVGPDPAGIGQPPAAATAPSGLARLRRRLAPLGAAIIALLAKLKALLLFLPKVKLLVTAASMAVSIVAYASIWGFAFAAGFVVLLLVHEMGHVIALRREGIAATPPMFIPFLGALISARSLGANALAEARVGLAGPILGSIGAGVCLLIWAVTGNDYWRALGYTGLFLNLFNLLPVVPLDGGRAMAAMSPAMWFVGFAGIVALAILFPNPVIFIIAALAALETYRRWQRRRGGRPAGGRGAWRPGRRTAHPPRASTGTGTGTSPALGDGSDDYYRVRPRDRALVGLVYLGLVAALVIGMTAAHLPRTLG